MFLKNLKKFSIQKTNLVKETKVFFSIYFLKNRKFEKGMRERRGEREREKRERRETRVERKRKTKTRERKERERESFWE